jgi:hypothetical protein
MLPCPSQLTDGIKVGNLKYVLYFFFINGSYARGCCMQVADSVCSFACGTLFCQLKGLQPKKHDVTHIESFVGY